jgi:hypothetical protein
MKYEGMNEYKYKSTIELGIRTSIQRGVGDGNDVVMMMM